MVNKFLRSFLCVCPLFCTLECKAFDETERLAASLKAVPSVLHTVSDNFITGGGKFSLFLALSAIVLIIGIIVFICGKIKQMNLKKIKLGDSEMSLITSVNLGRDKTLHLVELDGEKLLIGASKNSVSLVKELAKPLNENFCKSDFCASNVPDTADKKAEDADETESKNYCDIEIPEVMQCEKEESDIIGKLFPQEEAGEIESPKDENAGYRVNPEDYTLYKKYLS